MALARHMATTASAFRDHSFVATARSTQMQSHPWIAYPAGFTPIATANVLMSLERSLVAAIDQQLRQPGMPTVAKVNKGELFERVAQQCVSESIAGGSQDVQRPCTMKLSAEGDRDDVDLTILRRNVVEVIGETKAMEIPAAIDSAASTFHTQIGKAFSQLTVRLDGLRRGTPLVDGLGNTYEAADDVIGLGVVLQQPRLPGYHA